MINMLLACAGGLSTSMVMTQIKKAAKEKGIEVYVDATSVDAVASMIQGVDILLLGPQMSHAKGDMEKRYGNTCKIMVMDILDYGRMNGESILNKAIAEMNK